MPFGPYAYSNNGFSFKAVDSGYTPVSGEVVFTTTPTTQQLTAAFPEYPTLLAIQEASQAGLAVLSTPVEVQSTSTPSLNGVYSIDFTAQTNINAVVTYILLNGTFPGGGTTMPWMGHDGTPHVFPSVNEFKAFATAIASFVSAATLYTDSGGQAGSIQTQPLVIA